VSAISRNQLYVDYWLEVLISSLIYLVIKFSVPEPWSYCVYTAGALECIFTLAVLPCS